MGRCNSKYTTTYDTHFVLEIFSQPQGSAAEVASEKLKKSVELFDDVPHLVDGCHENYLRLGTRDANLYRSSLLI